MSRCSFHTAYDNIKATGFFGERSTFDPSKSASNMGVSSALLYTGVLDSYTNRGGLYHLPTGDAGEDYSILLLKSDFDGITAGGRLPDIKAPRSAFIAPLHDPIRKYLQTNPRVGFLKPAEACYTGDTLIDLQSLLRFKTFDQMMEVLINTLADSMHRENIARFPTFCVREGSKYVAKTGGGPFNRWFLNGEGSIAGFIIKVYENPVITSDTAVGSIFNKPRESDRVGFGSNFIDSRSLALDDSSYQPKNFHLVVSGVLTYTQLDDGSFLDDSNRYIANVILNHDVFNQVTFAGLPYIAVSEGGAYEPDAYTIDGEDWPDLVKPLTYLLKFPKKSNSEAFRPTLSNVIPNHQLMTACHDFVHRPDHKKTAQMWLLGAHRCFIDSLISSVLSGGEGGTLSGGLSADVVKTLARFNRSRAIAAYTPTGSDPLASQLTSGYLNGIVYWHATYDNATIAVSTRVPTGTSSAREVLYTVVNGSEVIGNFLRLNLATGDITVNVNCFDGAEFNVAGLPWDDITLSYRPGNINNNSVEHRRGPATNIFRG